MTQEQFLYEAVKLQKAYARLYGKGVIGIADDYVHLADDVFRQIFPEVQYTDWEDGWEQKETVYNGVTFLCLKKKGGE